MSGLTWGELSGGGELKLDVNEAIKQLKWMFEADDIVHLVNLRPKSKANKTNVISMGAKRDEMIEALPDQFEKICVSPWSTYVQIAPSTEIVEGAGVRPDKNVCAGTRVLFCDADTGKSGGFSSKDEVKYFIRELSVPPGLVVWTGSEGGAHLYWKLGTDGAEQLREEMAGRQIGERWWSYLDAETKRLGLDHVRIDRLIDLDARVLRLAGTIRFPKHEGDVTAPVVAEYFDVPNVDYDKFHELTDPAFEKYEARVKERRGRDEELLDEILEVSGRRGMWSDLVIFSMIDDIADRELEWAEILEGWGWTRLREGGDGSVEWTRPGGDGKSATTDWPESPGVMSLFSTDPSTGLLDLYEAEIPLTKWRVFLRLVHDDNVWEALDELGRRGSV